MIDIYINEEAAEQARSKEEKTIEKYSWRFLWFVVGMIFSYALIRMQGGH